MRTLEQDVRGGSRLTGCLINVDGTTSAPNVFSTKTGTGTYTVRFAGYRMIRNVAATLIGGAIIQANIQQPNTVTFQILNAAAAAYDAAFFLTVDGLVK